MHFLWNCGTCCSFLIRNLSLSSFSFQSVSLLLRLCHLRMPVSPCANLLTPPSHFSFFISLCCNWSDFCSSLPTFQTLPLADFFYFNGCIFLILELFFYKLNFPCFPMYWNKCYFLIWFFYYYITLEIYFILLRELEILSFLVPYW